MLRFKFNQLELRGKYYVPLPKMTRVQTEVIGARLRVLGFKVSGEEKLKADMGSATITLEGRGLCWSNRDLTDILAPSVPHILTMGEEATSLRRICAEYFQVKREGARAILRLVPRLESSTIWADLRATDSCALTPDEHAVYSFLLSHSAVSSEILTDFPIEGCKLRLVGKKLYYSGGVRGAEAAAALREIGVKNPRNSYLPKESILSLSAFRVSKKALISVMRGLGEWCFLTPKSAPRKL